MFARLAALSPRILPQATAPVAPPPGRPQRRVSCAVGVLEPTRTQHSRSPHRSGSTRTRGYTERCRVRRLSAHAVRADVPAAPSGAQCGARAGCPPSPVPSRPDPHAVTASPRQRLRQGTGPYAPPFRTDPIGPPTAVAGPTKSAVTAGQIYAIRSPGRRRDPPVRERRAPRAPPRSRVRCGQPVRRVSSRPKWAVRCTPSLHPR